MIKLESDRKQKILEILDRGNIVVFRSASGSLAKYVNEWNEDDDGDLKAFKVENAHSYYVCWYNPFYFIEEIEPTNLPK